MINDIKAKLPSKKKAKDEELDEDEDSSNKNQDATDPGLGASDSTGVTDIGELNDKPQTLIDKLKSKLIPKNKVAKDEVDDDGTSVGEVKKPAKKKINPIVLVVVVVAGLAIFLYEEEPEPVVEIKPPRKSLRTKPKDTAAEAPKDTTA